MSSWVITFWGETVKVKVTGVNKVIFSDLGDWHFMHMVCGYAFSTDVCALRAVFRNSYSLLPFLLNTHLLLKGLEGCASVLY